MGINGIKSQYQNYAVLDTSNTKCSSSESVSDSFSKAIINWEKRIKEAIDKQLENDRNGSIQMSEKQWRNLMKKVDNAIDTIKDKQKEQLQQKEGLRSKDTVVSTHKMDTQFLNPKVVGTFTYSAFLTASGKRD